MCYSKFSELDFSSSKLLNCLQLLASSELFGKVQTFA